MLISQNLMFKGIVSVYKGRVLLFLKHLKSTAQRDVMRTQAQAVSMAAWHLPRPQLSTDRA